MRRTGALLVALSLLALAMRAHAWLRPGFSPDEELTLFAVGGISAHGLPRLPSGGVYDRGLLYTYSAWLAGRIFGDSFASYRLVSALGGAATVALIGVLALRLRASPVMASVLAAAASSFVLASSWARFYALFSACFVATTLVALGPRDDARRERLFLLGLTASRLLHELGVVLVALPLFEWLRRPVSSKERHRSGALLIRSALVLAVLQLAVYGLQTDPPGMRDEILADSRTLALALVPPLSIGASPTSLWLIGVGAGAGGLLLRLWGRLPWAWCLIASLGASTLGLGALLFVAAGAALVWPARRGSVAFAFVLTVAWSLALWSFHTLATSQAAASPTLVWSLAQTGLAYTLPATAYLVRLWPLATAAALLGLVTGFAHRQVRAVAFLALSLLAFMGAVNLGPKPRYYLPVLALVFILAARVPAAVRNACRGPFARSAFAATSAVLLGLLLIEDRQAMTENALAVTDGLGWPQLRTTRHDRWGAVSAPLQAGGLVVCNDDLACRLMAIKADYWWLRSDHEASLYGHPDHSGWRSAYTGTPVLAGARALQQLSREGPLWLIEMDTGKYGYDEAEAAIRPSPANRLEVVSQRQGLRVLQVNGPRAEERGRLAEPEKEPRHGVEH